MSLEIVEWATNWPLVLPYFDGSVPAGFPSSTRRSGAIQSEFLALVRRRPPGSSERSLGGRRGGMNCHVYVAETDVSERTRLFHGMKRPAIRNFALTLYRPAKVGRLFDSE